MIKKYLDNRFLTLFLFPFLIGSMSVLSFQPFNFTFVNFFVLPIFFYLLVYIKKKSKSIYRKKPYRKNIFLFGTAFGFGFFLSGLHWITNSLTFDDNFKILIPFSLILIPLFLSLFFSLVSLLIGPFLNFNFQSIILLSSSLAFADYVRNYIFTGFPWNFWAYSFSWATEIIQILNISGLFAFNLISITIFMLPAVIFLNLKFIGKIYTFTILVFALLMFYIYGNHSINLNQEKIKDIENKINIKIVSPNFELEFGLNRNDIEDRLKKLIRYSDPKDEKQTLYIWPEGVFSGYSYKEILDLKQIFSKNFKENHFILFGVNRFNSEKKGVYNSLILVNNKMEIVQEYQKTKLVPFGEFLPFEKTLSQIGLKKITEGHGSFLIGEKLENLKFDKLNILPLICYEIIFTNLIQSSDKETNLIVNISEDGWFGNSIGPHQHFAKSIFRAIEHNTFLVRSANKGISAFISNKGEVIKNLNSYEAGFIQLEVPLIQNENKNKNDLIFFALLFTYILSFIIRNKYSGK